MRAAPLSRALASCAFLFVIIIGVSVSDSSGQKSKPALVCRKETLASVKKRPELTYECDEQLAEWDEKVLKLPARISAIKTLTRELSSFTDDAWWGADPVDLGACDYAQKPGTLDPDQRRAFLDGEYPFWLFGNDRIRLVLIPDPCYQTGYGGSNAFLLYRNSDRVYVTQVLDGYFSRADNPVNLAMAILNKQEIIEVSTWSGGLNPTVTNYYFVIDPRTSHAVPKNLFKGDHGPTNEISSSLLLSDPRPDPLKIVRGQTLAPSFSVYDGDGKRKILHWDGKLYR